MNEGDFDKKISAKLKDDHTNYPNLDKNWQKIVQKMAENPSSKPTAGGVIVLPNEKGRNQKSTFVPWLLAGMLLLLSSNAWFVWNLYETQNSPKPAVLDNIIVPQIPQTHQTVRLYDTIVETKIIYKIDTVYRTVVVEKNLSNQDNKSFKLNHKDNFTNSSISTPSVFSSNSDIKTVISHISQESTPAKKDSIAQNHLPILENFAQSHTNTDSLNNNSHKVAFAKTDSVKTAVMPYDSLELKPQQGLAENIIIKPSRKKLAINHYGFGLQGGTSWESPKLSGIDNGYWLGLTDEISFNKHLRLSLSADYMSFYYKMLTRSTLHPIPENPPMTENYNLKYIESQNPSVLVGLNIAYFLKPKSKINPFVSFQYSYRWLLPHTVEFEFTNKITGEEKSFKIENYSHRDSWLLVGAGVEMPLAKKVFGQLKAEYLYDPNHGNSSLKYALLRGGVFYRF